jgi:hypothetical protein
MYTYVNIYVHNVSYCFVGDNEYQVHLWRAEFIILVSNFGVVHGVVFLCGLLYRLVK